MKTPREKWVWMPHAGHFILGTHCRFVLNTRVGKYVISTVGEYWPEEGSRKIHAEIHDPKWWAENKHRMGDDLSHAYFKRFGFEELGFGRTYETMVFSSYKAKDKCCPWAANIGKNFEMVGYKNAADAYAGHMRLCLKYAKK